MRVPIDVVFYAADGAILHLIHSLWPWAFSPRVRRAAGVIELPAGTAAATRTVLSNRLRIG